MAFCAYNCSVVKRKVKSDKNKVSKVIAKKKQYWNNLLSKYSKVNKNAIVINLNENYKKCILPALLLRFHILIENTIVTCMATLY